LGAPTAIYYSLRPHTQIQVIDLSGASADLSACICRAPANLLFHIAQSGSAKNFISAQGMFFFAPCAVQHTKFAFYSSTTQASIYIEKSA
jgi:hypothetical protein